MITSLTIIQPAILDRLGMSLLELEDLCDGLTRLIAASRDA